MFFERHEGGERSLLVHSEMAEESEREDVHEFKELAAASKITVLDLITVKNKKVNPRYFISSGKVQQIKEYVKSLNVELVLFNHALYPGQEKNLEAEFQCRVVDRIGLILDIFAQRARTHEGKLQVELAQLEHLSTRLIRGWTHLERQKGGLGLRGPGETQLEVDRRLIRIRIKSINKKLEKVRKQRSLTRRSRQRAGMPSVSIVGYTNAGKSTLFNAITAAGVYVQDQLFATLDTTLRKLNIPELGSVIVADTVGFIRHLPHQLVKAFQATLEESSEADLLIHVVDCTSEERDDNIVQVRNVLKEISAEKTDELLVYNKIDQLPDITPGIDRDEFGVPQRVWISSLTGSGLDLLIKAIAERLTKNIIHTTITLDHSQGRLRSQLYALDVILSEHVCDNGSISLEVRMPADKFHQLLKNEPSEQVNAGKKI